MESVFCLFAFWQQTYTDIEKNAFLLEQIPFFIHFIPCDLSPIQWNYRDADERKKKLGIKHPFIVQVEHMKNDTQTKPEG